MSLPIRVTNLLPRSATTDGEAGTIVLGRWSEAECYMAPSSFAISDVATIQDGGTTLNLWQRDMTAIRYFQHLSDMRLRHEEAFALMEGVETALPAA
jgi:hypothetical protein